MTKRPDPAVEGSEADAVSTVSTGEEVAVESLFEEFDLDDIEVIESKVFA